MKNYLVVVKKFDFTFLQVIQGYERGVPGMCRGETRTLTVPSHLGYGDRGAPGKIPGGATLHFTVDLVKIKKDTLPPPKRPPPDKALLTYLQYIDMKRLKVEEFKNSTDIIINYINSVPNTEKQDPEKLSQIAKIWGKSKKIL